MSKLHYEISNIKDGCISDIICSTAGYGYTPRTKIVKNVTCMKCLSLLMKSNNAEAQEAHNKQCRVWKQR